MTMVTTPRAGSSGDRTPPEYPLMEPRRLLVVDDDDVDREAIQRQLGRIFEIVEADTAGAALRAMQDGKVDCVLLDYRLPDSDGLDLLVTLRSGTPVIMLTGQGGEAIAVEAMKRGASDYLIKGTIDGPALHHAIENAIEKARLRREVARQQEELRRYVAELVQQRQRLQGTYDELEARQAELTTVQTQLRHAQKMEALGRLAGGVAHDFNNVLTVVLSYAELVMHSLDAEHPAREDVQGIRIAARRAADLVRQLLAFARQQPAEVRAVAVEPALRALVPMLERVIGEDIELVVETAGGSAAGDPAGHRPASDAAGLEITVEIDPQGLEQVLMNLVLNARDAMPRGGRITIRTELRTLLRPLVLGGHGTAPPGEYVVISVRDQGSGISPEILDRIFEPFFTTKEPGKGTGLGLSTCYGIVRQAGGGIAAYSEPGQGATFEVYLLRSESDAAIDLDDAAVARTGARPAPAIGRGHVVVVEDDDQVRSITERALRRHGYDVVAVSAPRQAIDHARRRQEPIDLLVTDIVMPEMTGHELAAAVAELHPEAAVLFMSGYSPSTLRDRTGVIPDGAILTKPFTPIILISAVARTLADRRPPD